MSQDLDRLYDLLPIFDRQQDLEQGSPLRALLRVIAEQVNVVESNIQQLYANWFIETCEDWVVPYIGDLIGYQPVRTGGDTANVATPEGSQLGKFLVPRRDVAQTVYMRRRRGTLALLERLANDVSGWPAARAVEFYRHVAASANVQASFARRLRATTVDVSNMQALDWLGGAYDQFGHAADMRSIASHRSSGKYNLSNVGVIVWRLHALPITSAPAHQGPDDNQFTFSQLGNDLPLYANPAAPLHISPTQTTAGLPIPVRRQSLNDTPADYYGTDRSFAIWAEDWPRQGAPQPVDVSAIVSADLNHWRYQPRRGTIAVDPQLGRIAFPPNHPPRHGVRVSYFAGSVANIGGGEYQRVISQPTGAKMYPVTEGGLAAALRQWQAQAPSNAVIELQDSGVYQEALPTLELREGHTLQIRAANWSRPVLRLGGVEGRDRTPLHVRCSAGSQFTLDGVVLSGAGLIAESPLDANDAPVIPQPGSDPARIALRHVTLVPGLTLHSNGDPRHPDLASIVIRNVRAVVDVQHSIVGSLLVEQDDELLDPLTINITDSIVDATSPHLFALAGADDLIADVVLRIERTTVLGRVRVREIAHADNTIWRDRLTVERRQPGYLRFCYCPPGSRTPRRYSCQPDLERDRAELIHPQFESTRFGSPTYCRLAVSCPVEISRGADDESEMGVYHDMFEPQREANLRARLAEYTPARTTANVIFAD